MKTRETNERKGFIWGEKKCKSLFNEAYPSSCSWWKRQQLSSFNVYTERYYHKTKFIFHQCRLQEVHKIADERRSYHNSPVLASYKHNSTWHRQITLCALLFFSLYFLIYSTLITSFVLIYLNGGWNIHSSCSLLMIIFNSELFHVHFSPSYFIPYNFLFFSGENNFSFFSLVAVCTTRRVEETFSFLFRFKTSFQVWCRWW